MYLPYKRDPFALPDRRFRRALFLVDHGMLPSRKWDDHWVRQTKGFLSGRSRYLDEAQRANLARRWPHLYEAYHIYSAGRFPRWEIEARFLAAEPVAQIAKKCNVPVETIETYHEVFFSVAHRLRACDWVSNIVLGPRIHNGLAESDVDLLLKLYVYTGGPALVDVLVRYYTMPLVLPERLDQLDTATIEELQSRLALKRMIRIQTGRVGPRLLREYIRMIAERQDLGREPETNLCTDERAYAEAREFFSNQSYFDRHAPAKMELSDRDMPLSLCR